MARGVLGNDPFKRGAAAVPGAGTNADAAKKSADTAPPAQPAKVRAAEPAGKSEPAADVSKKKSAGRAPTPTKAARGAAEKPSSAGQADREQTAKARAVEKPSVAKARGTAKSSPPTRGGREESPTRAKPSAEEPRATASSSRASVDRKNSPALAKPSRAEPRPAAKGSSQSVVRETEKQPVTKPRSASPSLEGDSSVSASRAAVSADAALTNESHRGESSEVDRDESELPIGARTAFPTAAAVSNAAPEPEAHAGTTDRAAEPELSPVADRTTSSFPEEATRAEHGTHGWADRSREPDVSRVAARATSSIPEEATRAEHEARRAATLGAEAVMGLPRNASRTATVASTALAIGRGVVAQAASSTTLNGIRNTAAGLFRAVQTALGTAGATHVDDYGKDATLEKDLSPLTSFLYDTWWRIQVDGAQNLPGGAAILVANHSGAMPFDGPMLQAAVRRERPNQPEPRWLIEDQLFYAPFMGTLLNRLGAVRASPENALRLLGEDRPVVVFPEGLQGISKPFSERYKLMRFGRGGFVKLAIRARVPIVPIAIVGAEEASPLLARVPAKFLGVPYVPVTSPLPLPSKWTIRIGEPITIAEHPADAHEDLLLVNRLNERTRETIQGMLEAMLKNRSGVFA